MGRVHEYYLRPTDRVPNSPRPLLHYENVLPPLEDDGGGLRDPAAARDLFESNGWRVNWVFRYGPTQRAHYHSRAHECMAVLSGAATIRFGAADTDDDLEASTHGTAWETGDGVELTARAGDVFVIPAGVAHKTYDPQPPGGAFELLTPGTGHGIDAADPRRAIADLRQKLSGFTMLGAYPASGGEWDFVTGGGDYEKVWSVPKPARDPVFGTSQQGLVATWRGSTTAAEEHEL